MNTVPRGHQPHQVPVPSSKSTFLAGEYDNPCVAVRPESFIGLASPDTSAHALMPYLPAAATFTGSVCVKVYVAFGAMLRLVKERVYTVPPTSYLKSKDVIGEEP